jgi:hypothetical protein
MDVKPITRWILVCNHCGAPMEAGDPVARTTDAIPAFKTREEALKASLDIWDDDNQHPAVARVIIKGV